MKRRIAIPIITSLLWIGFVAAISFMEAWLKFRAETIIAGIQPEPSYMHFYYVGLEATKVILLITIVATNFNLVNSKKNTF